MPPAKARKPAAPRHRKWVEAERKEYKKKNNKAKRREKKKDTKKIWLAQLSGDQEHKEQQKAVKKEMELMASILALKDQWIQDIKPSLPLGLQESPFWNGINVLAAKARAEMLKQEQQP
jgi:hypothetical protein